MVIITTITIIATMLKHSKKNLINQEVGKDF